MARWKGLPLFIGLRYSFSRQRNRFIGVVSMVSLLGMALGVASLITVLSVMNGFAGELRNRILHLVPHISVEAAGGPVRDWRGLAERLQLAEQSRGVDGARGAERLRSGEQSQLADGARLAETSRQAKRPQKTPQVLAAAPFIETRVLLRARGGVQGAVLTAVDPAREAAVSRIAEHTIAGDFQALAAEPYGLIAGALLADALGFAVGDEVELTAPRLNYTPLGAFPRRKRFTVVGLFEAGTQLDATHAYTSLSAGQRLLGLAVGGSAGGGQTAAPGEVDGLRLRLDDLFAAPAVAAALQQSLNEGAQRKWRVLDWGQSQGSLFSAVRMEKRMMTVLLLSVVAVAAFNIISTLTMAVAEKRGDIAVLRAMGARAGTIMAVFVAQGLLLAAAGIAAGAALGASLAMNIGAITGFIESLSGAKLFSPEVYFISDLPSDLQWGDVALVSALALLLSVSATLFPAWRAMAVAPAEALRGE